MRSTGERLTLIDSTVSGNSTAGDYALTAAGSMDATTSP